MSYCEPAFKTRHGSKDYLLIQYTNLTDTAISLTSEGSFLICDSSLSLSLSLSLPPAAPGPMVTLESGSVSLSLPSPPGGQDCVPVR